MQPGREKFLTVEEVAGTFGVNPTTVYRLIRAREIPAIKIGGQWRFSQPALDAWVKARMTVGFAQTARRTSAKRRSK